MNSLVLFWLVVAAAFLVLEICTAALCAVWFVAGAAASVIAALLNGPLWLQILLFFVVSAACFVFLYPLAKRQLKTNRTPTNADMVIGQTCVVTQLIDNLSATGTVSVGGKTWSARSVTGEPIEEGRLVLVRAIEGVKLMVTVVPEDETED